MTRFRRWVVGHPDEAFMVWAFVVIVAVFFGLPFLMGGEP